MNFFKLLFGPPKTVITYAPNVTAQPPPAKPKPEAPPLPLEAHEEDEITLIDPVAKDEWSIGNPQRQQNVPWPKRKTEPKPKPEPEKSPEPAKDPEPEK